MKTSESIKEITKALVKFKQECPKVELNSTVKVATKTGGSYTFDYADLPYIKSIVEPILANNGLFLTQAPLEDGKLGSMLMHISGEWISSVSDIGNIQGKTSQEYGSLITYFKRYAYCAILGIAADKDDDANAADGNTANKSERKVTSQPPTKARLQLGTPVFEKCREAYLKDNSNLEKIKDKYLVDTEVELQLIKPIK
jgi:hypothetical protein